MGNRWAAARVDDDRSDWTSTEHLYQEFRRRDLARHLAFFYRSPQTQLDVAAAFVKCALRTGNRCLYFVDSNTRSAVETAFRAAGIDVEARTDANDLVVREGAAAYQEAGFDPQRLIALLREACEESVTDGYDGLWVAGEVTWCFHTDLSYDHVVDFEADFDAACPDVPVTALCQYDLNQFCETSVAKALWTHEQVIYRSTICENPFYIPPEEFRTAAEQPLDTQLMLEQAYNLAQTRRQVERREQRLSVVNRILRHDVRNDLNVVNGILDLVRESAYLSEEDDERLATAIEYADGVVETSDKARYVQRAIDHSSVDAVALESVVDRALERVEALRPDATVTVAASPDVRVVADTNLDIALTELLEHVLREQDATPPSATLTVSDESFERVRIRLDYPGEVVSTNDREVLERGEETQLRHCNGLGLWLAKWILENGRGSLEFPDDRAAICVTLRRATE